MLRAGESHGVHGCRGGHPPDLVPLDHSIQFDQDYGGFRRRLAAGAPLPPASPIDAALCGQHAVSSPGGLCGFGATIRAVGSCELPLLAPGGLPALSWEVHRLAIPGGKVDSDFTEVSNMRWQRLRYLIRPHVAIQILLERWLGIPFSKWLVNALFQRVFRLNADIPFQVHFTSTVLMGKGIVVGRNVWKSFALSGGCYIQGGNGIIIGDDTLFAPGVKVISANHDPKHHMAWAEAPPIRIGCRCWIGANAVILPGVELGDDCVVGAGAVVTQSFGRGSIVVGVPGKRNQLTGIS